MPCGKKQRQKQFTVGVPCDGPGMIVSSEVIPFPDFEGCVVRVFWLIYLVIVASF